jgi:predicted acylesterase/phospholipase RssA
MEAGRMTPTRKTQERDRRKHAVILSGGGAKGAYEIGVMKALFPGYSKSVSGGREIDPVAYTGTSVGSFNAAYMVSRPNQDTKQTLAELERIWRTEIAGSPTRPNGVLRFRANPFELMDLDRLAADPLAPFRNLLEDTAFFARESIERAQIFFRSQERLNRRAIQLIDLSTFVATDKLGRLIRERIALPEVRRNQDQALVVAATNWEQGDVKLFGNLEPIGELAGICPLDDKTGHLAILASTAIPGVFPPIEINHTKYVDGGLLLNTPLGPALRALRTIAPDEESYVIHVIYLDPDLKDVPFNHVNNTMDTLNRYTALSFASQVNRDVKQAKHINQSLELMEKADKHNLEPAPVVEALKKVQQPFRAFVKDRYRPITIHRYHPKSTLGGIFGLLAFDTDYIGQLIELGFNDGVTHDCVESGCIFPTLSGVAAANEASRKMKRRATERQSA